MGCHFRRQGKKKSEKSQRTGSCTTLPALKAFHVIIIWRKKKIGKEKNREGRLKGNMKEMKDGVGGRGITIILLLGIHFIHIFFRSFFSFE